jgi:hypothetical protein
MSNFLTLNELHRKAPSIFTEGCAERTSNKYQPISTATIIEHLRQEGFMPTDARQSNCRLKNKMAYTKHMVRFRHRDTQVTASQLFPELILINSHDGLSSYRLLAGMYRLICSNGLVAGYGYDDIRIRHQGDIIGNVIEGTHTIVNNAYAVLEATEKMASVQLNLEERQYFADAAHTLRFDDSEIGQAVESKKLLMPRRMSEVNQHDLFTVFNVVQENAIKGGVGGHARDKDGYVKRIKTREVKGIDQNTSLNRALWTLAEKMMQLKAVA